MATLTEQSEHVEKKLLTPLESTERDRQIAEAYFKATERIGKFFIAANGRQHIPHLKEPLTKFVPDQDLETKISTDYYNEPLMGVALKKVASVVKRYPDSVASIKPPANEVAQPEVTFVRGITDVVIPAINDFVNTLSPELQKQRHLFYTSDFVNRAIDDYIFGVSPQLTDLERTKKEAGEEVKTTFTYASLWYVAALANDKHAYRHLANHAMPFTPTSRASTVKKHKRSGGWWSALQVKLKGENKHTIHIDDIARHAIPHQLFEQDWEHAGEELNALRTLFKYSPNAQKEYPKMAEHFFSNARGLGKEERVLSSFSEHPAAHRDAAGMRTYDLIERTVQSRYQRVRRKSTKEAAKAAMDEMKQVLTVLREIGNATEQHKEIMHGLWRDRTSVPHKMGEHVDARTEGLMVRRDGKYQAFQRHMNEHSGYFYRLADGQNAKFMDLLNKIGVLKVFGLRYTSHDEMEARARRRHEATKDAAIDPPYLGKIYNLVGKLLLFKGVRKGYRNLRDKADFFTPATAVAQIGGQLIRGDVVGLITDAAGEAEFPDNPSTASTIPHESTVHLLNEMRPAYLDYAAMKTSDKKYREAYSRYKEHIGSLQDIVGQSDYPDYPNNVLTLVAIGMSNMRLGFEWDGQKFLVMSTRWGEKARSQKHGDPLYEVLANYELSVFLGNEEESTKHLVKAFDLYRKLTDTHKSPPTTEGTALDEFATLHPMNYEQRLEYVKHLRGKGQTHDAQNAAWHTYSELGTLLEKATMTEEEKKTYGELRAAFAKERTYAQTQIAAPKVAGMLPAATIPAVVPYAPRPVTPVKLPARADDEYISGNLDYIPKVPSAHGNLDALRRESNDSVN